MAKMFLDVISGFHPYVVPVVGLINQIYNIHTEAHKDKVERLKSRVSDIKDQLHSMGESMSHSTHLEKTQETLMQVLEDALKLMKELENKNQLDILSRDKEFDDLNTRLTESIQMLTHSLTIDTHKMMQTISINISTKITRGEDETDCTAALKSLEETKKKSIRQRMSQQFKNALKNKHASLFEGPEETKVELDEVYTEINVTEGVKEDQHEMQTQQQTKKSTTISCNEILKSSSGTEVRTVMTTGIAGIGKSVIVQKFCLDWARREPNQDEEVDEKGEGRANRDVDFILELPFQELNLLINEKYSLHSLLLYFYPELKGMSIEMLQNSKILFIFDGLDESKLELNFRREPRMHDITTESSINSLIINLIKKKNLLPSSLIWITSRPAASYQIPSDCVDKWTEVRGFNDTQKDEYFRRRLTNTHSQKIISQIKKVNSLYNMCQIPVFCWILTRVHQENPTTMTELFIHFLVAQTTRKDRRAGQGETSRFELLKRNKQHILGLSELAFKLLEEERILFSKQDLEEMDIDDSVIEDYSEMFTISKKDQTSCTDKFYRFVHQSVQEFLAALHVLCRFVRKDHKALEYFIVQGAEKLKGFQNNVSQDKMPLHVLLNGVVDKALQCTNGHLDLFLRFLLGISLECNLKLLQGLLPPKKDISESGKATAEYIKEILSKDNTSVERCLNLLLCLLEMNDGSLHKQIEEYVRSGRFLKPDQCSIQSYMLLTSKEVLDEFNLTVYKTSQEGRERLLVVLRSCRKAQLNGCGLSEDCCGVISDNLQLQTACLRELDLSSNPLKDAGLERLSDGLKQKNCRLEKLRLAGCGLSGDSCRTLSSVLQSEHSQLREMDLSANPLKDSGVELLSAGLKHSNCRLDTLRLTDCKLTGSTCQVLQSAIASLTMLDLTNNNLTDAGVEELCVALKHRRCKLQVLRLSGCLISQRGCEFIVSALTSNPESRLTELDLSYNHPGYVGLQMLFRLRRTVNINIDGISEGMLKGGMKKYACELTLDPNTACRYLLLSEGNRKATYVNDMQQYPDHLERLHDNSYQVLSREPLTGRCYWECEGSGLTAGAGVAYSSIDRKGHGSALGSGLGSTNKSWSLMCIGDRYSVLHNGIATDVPAPAPDSRRLGVYVDREAGTLSFHSVSSDTLTHLHTFYTTFTDEPLLAAFMAFSDGDSVALG